MTAQNSELQESEVVDYLEYFGLCDDPFEPEEKHFYDGGSRRELFSELLHLCQFSAGVLVVLGEEGVGKENLKISLSKQFADHDRLIDFTVPVLCSPEQVLHAVAINMGIDLDTEEFKTGDINHYVGLIRQFLHEREDDDSLNVLMLSNAHNLDQRSLKVLMQLSAPGEQNPYRQLHIILFAEPVFEQRIEQLESTSLLQVFHLQPLTPVEIKHYLRFCLDEVGFSGIFPYKDPDIQFLWDISKGVPGKFHDAAREILIELALPPPQTKTLGMPATHLAAVFILLAGLLAVFFYNSGTNDESDGTKEVEISHEVLSGQSEESKAPTLGSSVNSFSNTSEQQSENANSSIESDSSKEIATTPRATQTETETNSSLISAPNVVRPATELKSKSENQKETILSSEQAAIPVEDKPTTPKPVKKIDDIEALVAAVEKEVTSLPVTADEKELLNRASNNFTLQVLAGGSRAAVDEFIKRQPNQQSLLVFAAKRNENTLYIVVTGDYSSAESARLAVANLPQEQKKAGPWPRSLQSVQAEIKSFHGN